jgi:hypothetical protein
MAGSFWANEITASGIIAGSLSSAIDANNVGIYTSSITEQIRQAVQAPWRPYRTQTTLPPLRPRGPV